MMRLVVRSFLIVALSTLAAGCSDDADRVLTSEVAFDPAPVAAYFPLAADYATVMNVRYADGHRETVTFEVGEKQALYEYQAYPLYGWDDNTRRTTSYVVVTDSSLYIFASGASSPEKLLSLPLRPGAQWDRYDVSDLARYATDADGDDTEIATGDDSGTFEDVLEQGTDDQADDESDGDSAGDRPLRTSFPTSGGTMMQVQTVESIVLSDGTVYAGAVRVSNEGAYGTTNYYWFVPGVGLAKYVLGATPRAPYTGSVVGEIVDYGVGLK